MAAHTPTDATFAAPVQPDQPATSWAPWLREIAGAMNQFGAKLLAIAASYLPLTGGTITGDLTIDGALSASSLTTGNGVSTGDASIELGGNRTDNGNAYLDLHATASTDYEFRIIRNAGVNGSVQFQQSGAGNYSIEGGNVGINAAPQGKLHVAAASGYIFVAQNTNAATGDLVALMAGGLVGADTTTALAQFMNANFSAVQGAIQRNGVAAVVYATSSDERLKEAISDSQLGLEELMQIKVRDYTFKADDRREHGLIAQELAQVYPIAVAVGGDDPQKAPWMIDYGRLTPLLIKAIQQQQELLQATLTRLAALEARVGS